ncbi:hypothetical protein T492DRAFT_847820 [Pavlovales sp. CCMP2436]|nr:hypothetical protein T492DRAFT_847820 [Pavlovales sp. CCMP2436]
MSNVYGALPTTGLEIDIERYAVLSSATTLLSFSAAKTPQNQTRDTTKILKKKLPANTGADELSIPFDKSLYTSPLTYVAELPLPISLGRIITKSVDTKLFKDESAKDPKASTYTIYQIKPEDVVQGSNASKNILGLNQTNARQIKYDVARFVDEKNLVTLPYDPTLRFTFIFGNSNLLFCAESSSVNISFTLRSTSQHFEFAESQKHRFRGCYTRLHTSSHLKEQLLIEIGASHLKKQSSSV